jgi:hypothetical protein
VSEKSDVWWYAPRGRRHFTKTKNPLQPWNGLRSTTEGVPMETTSNTAAIYVRRSAADEFTGPTLDPLNRS